jgi:molybdenum cofactor synthesis domain-containing protein
MIGVAVLTISDSVTRGTRVDAAGPALCRYVESMGWQLGEQRTVADDEEAIAEALKRLADSGTPLIVTTGGTGVAIRDVTPEATRRVIDREIPGLSELMRMRGLEKTPFAVLSRGVAGTRGRSLIVNLPGNPKGAVESLAAIQHLIPHVLELLAGHTEHDNAKLRP